MTQEITVRAFTPEFLAALNTNFSEIDAALDALSESVTSAEGNFAQGNFGGGPYTSGDITVTASISGNTLDVTATNLVNIGPGMTITGTGVTTCNIVMWAGGGSSGGVGTYIIDGDPQTVSSRTMTIRGEATATVVGRLAVTDTPNAGEWYDTYDINVLRYGPNGAWLGLRGRYNAGPATVAGVVLANHDGDLEAGFALNNASATYGPGNRGAYLYTGYGHLQFQTNFQAGGRTWFHLEGAINTDLPSRNGLEGYIGLGGETNPISPLTLRGNAPGLNGNWALSQFTIWGTNNNQRLSIGYDTTNDQGVIQAGKNGVGWKELLLNPAGGNVSTGAAFTAGSLNTGGPATVAGEITVSGITVGLSKAEVTVTDLAALKTITSPYPASVNTKYRSTADDQGGGMWVFRTGDRSASVSADTLGGVWVPPNSDVTGASGAWQRQYSGPVNVKWFGAGAGLAYDAAAIQAAVNISRDVYVPAGSYYLSTAILLTVGYSTLIGSYAMPIFYTTASVGPAIKILSNGGGYNELPRVENIILYCSDKPSFASTPSASNCALAIDGSAAGGAAVAAAVQRTIVRNMRIIGHSCGIWTNSTVNTLIDRVIMEHHTDWSAEVGYTSANQYVGIYLESTPYSPGGISPHASIQITGCLFNGAGAPTAAIATGFKVYGADPRDIFFADCETAGGHYGWYIKSTGTSYNIDIHIKRAIVDAVQTTGIYIEDYVGAATLSVTGGYIVKSVNNSGAGIWLENCDGVSISGGTQVIGVALDSANDEGIRIRNSSACSVVGVEFMNCRTPVSLDASASCTIAGNTIYSAVSAFEATPTLDYGIRLFNTSQYNTITGNSIKGASASYKITYGIYVEAGSTKNTIVGNAVDAATVTTPYTISASDNVVLGTSKFLTGAGGNFTVDSSGYTTIGNKLFFNGTAATDTAWRRSSTTIEAVLGNESDYAHIKGKNIDATGNLAVSGNIGVNTTASWPLDVNGVIRSTGVLATLAVSKRSTGTGDAWYIYSGSGELSFYDATAAVARASIDTSGNFVIGGNPPTAGRLQAVGSSGGVSLALSDNVNNSLYVKHAAGGAQIGTDPGGALRLAANGFTTGLTVNSSANVEIANTLLATNPSFTNSIILRRTAGSYGLDIATNNGTGNSTISTAGAGATLSLVANGSTAVTFSGSETQLGGALKMGVAYVGGAPAATGYITVKDSAGTTYKLLAST